jgi:hypothetical protein
MAAMPKTHTKMGEHMSQSIELSQECHNTCVEVLSYSLQSSTEYLPETTLRLLRDCAEICQTNANFLLRSSEFHAQICGVCAEICGKCATTLEQFTDDSRLQQCADICQRCAEACQVMMAMAVPR